MTKKEDKSKKKYSIFLEALRINIVNLLVIMFLWSIIDSVDLFNPFEQIFNDFDYTDLYFSEFLNDQIPTDDNVFIVNIGNLDRMELAMMINTLERFEPKVIGIDAVFHEKRGPEDLFLRQALTSNDNIVLGVFGQYEGDEATGIIQHHPFFGEHPIGHLEFQMHPKTVRDFDKFIEYNDTIVNAFTAEIMHIYDSTIFETFMQRKGKVQLINFRGGELPFISFDAEQISDSNKNLEIIKDKIVLLGYMRQYQGAPFDLDDSHFSPLKRSEHGFPDVKGIEIHAHVLSMMINDNYIIKVPDWLNYLIALIITQLFLMMSVYLYVRKSRFFDFISKPVQFLSIILILWATFTIFQGMKIKIDMVPTILALILSLEVLYLYEEALELLKINTYLTQNFKFDKNGKKKRKKIEADNTIGNNTSDSESDNGSEHRV